MSEKISLPMPMPNLTRLHTFNGLDTIIADLDAFLQEHISLIILGTFENAKILLENANQLCLQDGAHPNQRVLWINKIEQMAALQSQLEEALAKDFPEKEVDINNIRAISVVPKTKEIAYIIYIDPSLSPDPKDKRKKLSTFQMERAFKAAIKAIPNPDNQ
ncbi:MAG: hypothetical protein AAGG68_24605 [Bacteroidota bacterium]